MGSVDSLRGLVARELAGRSEPWARRFLDPDTGQAHADVVDALTRVGLGLARDAMGDPLTEDAVLEEVAAWLAAIGLPPDDPRNAERPRFQTGVRMQFEDRGDPQPSARGMDALAEIALGAAEQSHPRAARIASPELVVAQYLRGSDVTPYVSVVAEAVEIATPAPVSRARVARARAKTARQRAAKRGSTARRARGTAAKTAARKKKRAAVTSKRKSPKRVAGRRAKARSRTRARTKAAARTRTRTGAGKKARRKKK